VFQRHGDRLARDEAGRYRREHGRNYARRR
jgi:hypothetical protein